MAGDRYKTYRLTTEGAAIEAMAKEPSRYPIYAAFSKADLPAFTGLLPDLRTQFPSLSDFAMQAAGAFVGEVMRGRGHAIKRRARVPGGGDYVGTAAVWTAEPVKASKAAA
jgi:hypothetical protein